MKTNGTHLIVAGAVLVALLAPSTSRAGDSDLLVAKVTTVGVDDSVGHLLFQGRLGDDRHTLTGKLFVKDVAYDFTGTVADGGAVTGAITTATGAAAGSFLGEIGPDGKLSGTYTPHGATDPSAEVSAPAEKLAQQAGE